MIRDATSAERRQSETVFRWLRLLVVRTVHDDSNPDEMMINN